MSVSRSSMSTCITATATQGIFYERPDVFTVSIHADPSFFYPFVWAMRMSVVPELASAPISTFP